MWLKDGDRNTKFFHNKASQRSKDNHIGKIKDSNGVWSRGDDKVEVVFLQYFREMFNSSNPIDVVQGKLSSTHKEWCTRDFIVEEIRDAISQIHPLKAPGPDGLSAMCFEKYWYIVSDNV